MDTKPLAAQTSTRDTVIVFRNSQGAEIRATPLRLTHYEVVFEVYNPFSILQLSEVLSDFRIIINERMVYHGRAVVSKLVNAGIFLVLEAALDEAWLEVDLFTPLMTPGRLRQEFTAFIQEWEKMRSVTAAFKVLVSDLQTLLVDLRRWLEQVELSIRADPEGNRDLREREVVDQLQEPMVPLMMSWFTRFDEVADSVGEEMRPAHRAYARRQLHPLLLCSPFVYRTYQKPLGYAGDYEMVNMILGDPLRDASSLFAKIVNLCFLKNPPAEAHRNRIRVLTGHLVEETRRVARLGRPARILNLGCGPAQEIQNFLAQHPECEAAEFTLLDFNDETIEFTRQILGDYCQRYHRSTPIHLVKKSVHQVLKESSHASDEGEGGAYDFIYCAGLFDYMSDRICKRLSDIFYEMLAPGGLLLATNVDASKPFRHSMEYLLEWHLICRSPAEVRDLAPAQAPADACQVTCDPTAVNVFLEVRRPGHA